MKSVAIYSLKFVFGMVGNEKLTMLFFFEGDMKISTRDLNNVCGIDKLKSLCQSLAMLDAIIEREWEFRYYSFDSHWNDDEMLASMRNGSGDNWCVLFNSSGAIIKGESVRSPFGDYYRETRSPVPGLFDGIPMQFRTFLNEPAFAINQATFCLWRMYGASSWSIGNVSFPMEPDPDGSEALLSILDGNPLTFKSWAEEYHETPVSIDVVTSIYNHDTLTSPLIKMLNPDLTIEDLIEDIKEIDYPVAN